MDVHQTSWWVYQSNLSPPTSSLSLSVVLQILPTWTTQRLVETSKTPRWIWRNILRQLQLVKSRNLSSEISNGANFRYFYFPYMCWDIFLMFPFLDLFMVCKCNFGMMEFNPTFLIIQKIIMSRSKSPRRHCEIMY